MMLLETTQEWVNNMPELITSGAGASRAPERDGLKNLALSVAADLRGNPAEALEHLSTLPPGESLAESLTARGRLLMEQGQYAASRSRFRAAAGAAAGGRRGLFPKRQLLLSSLEISKGVGAIHAGMYLKPGARRVPGRRRNLLASFETTGRSACRLPQGSG